MQPSYGSGRRGGEAGRSRGFLWAAVLLGPILTGCGEDQPAEVTVYVAQDEEYAKPLFDAFSRRTGVLVRAKYDAESTKTVGLAEAILAERARPRCDLFWNNEVVHTLRLARQGVLRPAQTVHDADYPPGAVGAGGAWHGFAARARVLLVNTNLVKEARWPDSILDLTDPQWYDRAGIAKPLFGTTATHAACLFAVRGDDEAAQFFRGVKRNARIMAGNRQVAQAVAAGTLDFGLTDTDDAMQQVERGAPVKIIYPDQGEQEMGTLFIPNTLALVRGSANPQGAEMLLDFLLSPDAEGRLVMGPSAQVPLNTKTEATPRIETPESVRAMDVDFDRAAEAWDRAAAFLRDEFTAN